MARGNNREPIVHDENDVAFFMASLGVTCARYAWRVYAWCIMPNHYHLVIATLRATLSLGMRRHNSTYAQWFNQRHGRVGHVFQGRFKAKLVQRERYLLALMRYVELNPWRAALVAHPVDWDWSSIHCSLGRCLLPPWSCAPEIWAQFGRTTKTGIVGYREYLLNGMEFPRADFSFEDNSAVLGDAAFQADHTARVSRYRVSQEIPAYQNAAPSLPAIFSQHNDVDAAIKLAYYSGHRLREIAGHLGVHYSTISRIARRDAARERGSAIALAAPHL